MTALEVLAPGIHTVPAEQYHADQLCDQPTLSAGICRLLANATPLHAWTAHPKLNPAFVREEKQTFDLGTVAHELLLEGTFAKVVVIEADSWRTKDAQEKRDNARADGMVPLLEKDWQRVEQMVTAVRKQLEARDDDPPLLSDGVAEPTLVWKEPGGVMCRSRLDWLRHDLRALDDAKTTSRSADPVKWAGRTMWQIGCDVQVAFQLRGVRALTDRTPEWRYIVIENTPPYALSVVSLAASALELGQQKVERALERWRECLKADRWPGYPTPTYYAEAPAWAEFEFMEHDAEAMTA